MLFGDASNVVALAFANGADRFYVVVVVVVVVATIVYVVDVAIDAGGVVAILVGVAACDDGDVGVASVYGAKDVAAGPASPLQLMGGGGATSTVNTAGS